MPENIKDNLKGLRVLLVDDDAACRRVLALGLEMQGVTVVEAESAEDGMSILTDSSFDAIATDLNLPGADGMELLRFVRKHKGDVPVILITGYSSISSAVDALKLGAQDYLSKPIENPDLLLGVIWRAVEHHRTMTHNKALQERLDRAEKMESLANIAGGVAHDLNNIISPMVSLPDIMLDELQAIADKGNLNMSELREDIELMKASGSRAAAVVRDLMTSSRRMQLEKKPLDLNIIVNNCITSQEVRDMLSGNGRISIESDLECDECVISASEPHVSRAVFNLVRNGIDAMSEVAADSQKLVVETRKIVLNKPHIGYELIEEGKYARLRVSDSGSGIKEEIIPRIVEPFFTTKKESGKSGSGLGLAIVNGIMKDHDGFIDIKSDTSSGTVFDLYFPLSDAAVRDSVEHVIARGGYERILVVDDEPAQRIVARRMLSKLGYSVEVVNNGREALNAVRQAVSGNGETPFDLVILDMIMEEDFDGFSTLTEIRKICPTQKAIMASGYAPTGRVQSAVDIGASWLAKPYDIQQLASSVRSKLDEGS